MTNALFPHLFLSHPPVLFFIYIMAGIVQWSDNFEQPDLATVIWCDGLDIHKLNPSDNSTGVCSRTFFESLYMATTTVATVGYGDISPMSILSKVLISIMMLIVFVVIPQTVIPLSLCYIIVER